jgi:uncharacterized membrane protein YfcA
MPILEIIGYFGAIMIGVALGLLGGGGSILAVPIFAYLFGIDKMVATAYSLFVVGVSSIAGAFSYFERDLISYRTVLFFGVPATLSVFLNRYFVIPLIPENLLVIDGFVLTKGASVMLLFSLLMILSARIMIKGREVVIHDDEKRITSPFRYFSIIVQGLFIGFITSLVGAGGGFLIIPSIIALFHLPVKKAIGTSLCIVMMNSLIGFSGDIGNIQIEWIFLIKFSGLSLSGIFLGSFLSKRIPGSKLKPMFGWFVLIMGVWIIIKETIIK